MAAHALGLLAVLATVLGIASWQGGWHVVARPLVRAQRGLGHAAVPGHAEARAGSSADRAPAHHENELRIARAGRDEQADLAPRSPSPSQAARARSQERQDFRLSPADDAAAIAFRDGQPAPAAIAAGAVERRGAVALLEVAPESAGNRAANPVRGPPAVTVTSM